MSFEQIGFASLFHDGFTIDSTSLLIYLALENEIRPYAERVLLTRLALGGATPRRPRVTRAEIEARFDAMRRELDYLGAARTSRFLSECSLTLEEADTAIAGRLALEKLVDRLIAGLWRDRAGREAVCREAFLDLELREHVIRAAGLGLLARDRESDASPSERALAAAREHLLRRHGCAEWTALRERLTRTWRIADHRVEGYVRDYAAALMVAKSPLASEDAGR